MAGPLFVDSPGQVETPGVAAVDVQAPTIIEEIPLGKIALVGQFDWGPINTVYEPLSSADFLRVYAPPGSSRTTKGYQAVMKRKGMSLAAYRVQHATGVKASSSTAGTGGNVTGTAKYEGTLGNSIILRQEASSDGVSGSKKFTAILTDTNTGTTSEVIADNVAPPNGTALTVDVTNSVLLSAFGVDTALTAFPANADFTFSSGANGSSITAADYDTGMTALDNIDDVAVLCTDDCGDSIRTAVNGYVKTHTTSAAGRYIGIAQGPSGNSWSATKTDKASYVSKWLRYSASWVYVTDDAGTSRLVPWNTFMASALINLEPQQSDAWRAERVTKFYDGVDSIYTVQYNSADATVSKEATNLGISLAIRTPDGRTAGLHDRNTSLTVADRYTVTSRIRSFLAKSLIVALAEFINAPNILEEQNDLIKAVKNFLDGQEAKGRIIAYVLDGKTSNTAQTVAQGYFYLAISCTTPAPMEKIVLLLKAGPTVEVTDQAA